MCPHHSAKVQTHQFYRGASQRDIALLSRVSAGRPHPLTAHRHRCLRDLRALPCKQCRVALRHPHPAALRSWQTGAAAVVLAALFGEEYPFTDHTHDERGLPPRSFATFTEMAEEAAISRLYGGIHYRAAIELGLEQGRCIGELVNELRFQWEA